MLTPGTTETELSPLDQIRRTEAEVTRQIAAAREFAEQTVIEARKQVKALLDEARASGYQQGQIRYKEIVSRADEEARILVAQAQGRAEVLRRKGKQRMATAVRYALNYVLALEEEKAEEK